jgi:hypothetical protein
MRKFQTAAALTLIGVILIAPAVTSGTSGEWNLRRNTGNGACSVQPADSLPQLGAYLAKHATRKAACEDAKSRKTDDAADTTKCFAYTAGTKRECKAEGVDLPD